MIKKDERTGAAQNVRLDTAESAVKFVALFKKHKALASRMEDLELIALCKERENDPTITVSIDKL
ncbi:hypothetical protein [Pseudomonas sp. PB120]|uniref:hypothetical protein n=1 Tax=Pseudomonas sp. PB120 TaxID=2494700 RepID=UPI0021155BA3|nr:hypothetical protein [Pseudomonas sp. PB120]